MKKFLSVLLASAAISLQAQTLLVNDFESGLGGAYVAVDGICELIDNPTVDEANPSSKVLKIVSDNYAQVGFPVTFPTGKTFLDYTGVRFQAAILEKVDGSDIHWIGFNVGVSDNLESMELVDPVAGNGPAWGEGILLKWVDVELLFNEELLAEKVAEFESEEQNVMIKLGREKFIYAIDNIRLVEKEVLDNPNIIFTFENMDLGESPRFGMPFAGSCEVVENTYKSAANNSEKSLKVVNPEYSPLTMGNALPDGKKWTDYEAIKFQICITAGDTEDVKWAGIELGVRDNDGNHTKIGAAYDEEGQETAAYGDFTIGEWMNIQLTINSSLITEEVDEVATLYIRLMKEKMEYLLDNVELVPVGSATSIENNTVSTFRVVGGKNQVNIEIDQQTLINIFTVEGKKINTQMLGEGSYTLNLPAGLYIVNNSKVVVY